MPAARHSSSVDIIDVRNGRGLLDLKKEVVTMFNSGPGVPRTLPTLLLYDEKGLQLFEHITHLDEYYLTNHEIEVLKQSAADIASKISAGSMVIELGSGNLRKVCLLLQALEDQAKPTDYYALDLSETELQRSLAQLPDFKYVSCHGLLGTYDDGREWLKDPALASRPKTILHLGSSIGNFTVDEASEFLAGFAEVLEPADSIIIGVDSCDDPDKVYHAYNDKEGITHKFILNGLNHVNNIFGQDIFHAQDWRAVGEYVFDEDGGRHQAFVAPIRETMALGAFIKPSERIQIEQSRKYTETGYAKLWKKAGLIEVTRWSRAKQYGLYMLSRANMSPRANPSYDPVAILPTLGEWEEIWKTWDMIANRMLPEQELKEKPIKLRNACIFYLGHIPTFLDIQLTKGTQAPATEPASYRAIFERGIDPDVDDPEKCHDHSQVPDEWPPIEEILAYQDRVRARIRSLYEHGADKIPRHVGRTIWLGYEHEAMHVETYLYMLLQSNKTLPPPHTEKPDFEGMAREARAARVPNQWFDVPEQTITLGMDDPEESEHAGHFGWDIEKPARKETVHAFQAQGRPITNQEFAHYLYHSKIDRLPASWTTTTTTTNAVEAANETWTTDGTNGASHSLAESFLDGKAVRTVYGPVPLKYALDWPVSASYDELAGCAAWMGGRIPTFEETRSIYSYVLWQQKLKALNKLANMVPAVNGHLVNDGVEETPPQGPSHKMVDDEDLFIDLEGANVGFKAWHPVPVTARGGELAGQGGMGGLWEWTSSPLRPHEGYAPMPLYPGYSADFFDDKHNVVLGGSWATMPRLAGRASFVNWYQRNYLYMWAGARVVRDRQSSSRGGGARFLSSGCISIWWKWCNEEIVGQEGG